MKKASVFSLVLFCFLASVMAFGQGAPPQPQATAADKAKIKQLERSYKAAKAAFAKSPKSPKARKDFVSITTLYGHESMMTPALDRKVKYRQALHLYREVLKVDPNEPTAKRESEFLIKIYKQLGRPVPND